MVFSLTILNYSTETDFINMIYNLKLCDHNREVYIELLKEMSEHGDGLFSFVLKISAGEIVDLLIMDNLPPDGS